LQQEEERRRRREQRVEMVIGRLSMPSCKMAVRDRKGKGEWSMRERYREREKRGREER
jgi:hypothetical protein